ncbi:uncharacterized protein TNCV_2268661 [Trichonephila clavipes]|nr:uncharacterized protein TNCV_2268661 [Trichonephila clavipes]
MTNLGLKTPKVVPCYCHHTLPTMWEALNTTSLNICRTICESGHLLRRTILAISCLVANRLPRIGSKIMGIRSKLQGQIKFTEASHRIVLSENGYFDVSGLLKTGYFHLTPGSPTE